MLKYRIVNKNRFIFSLTLVILILYLSLCTFLETSVAEGVNDGRVIEIHIKEGDTLWDIAKNFGPKRQDIRMSIYEISSFNNLSSSEIYPGQIIKIPSE